MRRALGLVLSFIALLAHAARPDSASACSPTAHGLVMADGPANGVFQLLLQCPSSACFESADFEQLTVVDTVTGDEVPGAIVRRVGEGTWQTTIGWKPDQPLVEGRTYELAARPADEDSFYETDYEFVAEPALTAPLDSLEMRVVLELVEDYSVGSITCMASSPGECGDDEMSVALNVRDKVSLSVYPELATMTPALLSAQYEMRAALYSADEEVPELEGMWPSLRATHEWSVAASAYCYRVELVSLIDGSSVVHEDCVDHGDLGTLETVPVSAEELASDLTWCPEPPEGYEAQWCRARRDYCAESTEEVAFCDDLDIRCADVADAGVDGGMTSDPIDAGANDGAIDEGENGDTPSRAHTHDDDAPGTGGDNHAGSGGCSVGTVHSMPNTHSALALLALALSLLGARRKTR